MFTLHVFSYFEVNGLFFSENKTRTVTVVDVASFPGAYNRDLALGRNITFSAYMALQFECNVKVH